MTVEEAKLKYGTERSDYYVYCQDCPLRNSDDCLDGCRGYDDTWEHLAKVMTERENNKPTETDDLELDCESCAHEHLDVGHPTCSACIYEDADNYEEKCCENCKHCDKDFDEEPCVHCRNSDPDEDALFWESTLTDEEQKYIEEDRRITHELVEKFHADNVIHPSHYNQGGIECWDAMEAAYGKDAVKHFCICNAFKYVWRADHKNGMEDINKAINYLNKYKELSEG